MTIVVDASGASVGFSSISKQGRLILSCMIWSIIYSNFRSGNPISFLAFWLGYNTVPCFTARRDNAGNKKYGACL